MKIKAKFTSPNKGYWVAYTYVGWFRWKRLGGYSSLAIAMLAVSEHYKLKEVKHDPSNRY